MYAIRSYYGEAVAIAEDIGYPVVLKISSVDITQSQNGQMICISRDSPPNVSGLSSSKVVAFIVGCVITSYSIHYTKLYECGNDVQPNHLKSE